MAACSEVIVVEHGREQICSLKSEPAQFYWQDKWMMPCGEYCLQLLEDFVWDPSGEGMLDGHWQAGPCLGIEPLTHTKSQAAGEPSLGQCCLATPGMAG